MGEGCPRVLVSAIYPPKRAQGGGGDWLGPPTRWVLRVFASPLHSFTLSFPTLLDRRFLTFPADLASPKPQPGTKVRPSLISTSSELSREMATDPASGPGAQYDKWMRGLREIAGDHDARRARIPSPADTTCTWLLDQHQVWSWYLNGNASSFLWITGNAKCGKSVLANYLVRELPTLVRGSIVCSYFFPEDGDDYGGDGKAQPQDSCRALSALVHQLFTRNPQLASSFRHQLEPWADPFGYTTSELWAIFCGAAQQSESGGRPVVCVLDGLDWCAAGPRGEFIENLVSSLSFGPSIPLSCKLLITSRPLLSIERSFFSRCGKAPRLKLEDSRVPASAGGCLVSIDGPCNQEGEQGVEDAGGATPPEHGRC